MAKRFSFSAQALLVSLLLLLVACAPAPPPAPTAAPTRAPATAPEAKPSPAAAPSPSPAASPATKSAGYDEKAVADFYAGKTVRIIVGFSAGGGFDTYSRVIGRHLGKYIPGNPSVIVENMPGAGSVVAGNHLYLAAPKDGTVIGNIQGPAVLEQLFKTEGIQFDMARFRYLAVPVPETYLMIVTKRTGISKFEDLLGSTSKQMVAGGIPGSTVEHAPILLRDVFGANIKVVSGYEGTSKVRLAIESGEVDGFFNTWQSVKTTNRKEVENGDWVVLAQLGPQPINDLPVKAPTIPDLAKTEDQKQILLFGTSYPNQFGKVYIVPPETPADRVAALEAAFLKTMRDRELLADAEKANLEIAPLSGTDAHKLVVETLGMSEATRNVLRKAMKG
jgi:tripartite-type tricarboxylate transporter receptor subunit TctC